MNLIALLILSIILNSCSGLGEVGSVLRNEKTKSTDEFLIEKKEPLTQPPDFKKIPEPGSLEENAATDQSKIKKMLKRSQIEPESNKTKSSSTEESILKKIKK
jgi:hypothetical protein|tara:strand:- start:187 stop:495 length:309 start_codon:yes stop_codon:yes gene_type:complete